MVIETELKTHTMYRNAKFSENKKQNDEEITKSY